MKGAELSNGGQECGIDMVGRLALEAEFRGMSTGELIGQLIAAAIENDMVKVVLDQSRGNRTSGAGRIA
jgi:hypothetical protein